MTSEWSKLQDRLVASLPGTVPAGKKCSGCYDSFGGPWCDNCDQWPCICTKEDEEEEDEGV